MADMNSTNVNSGRSTGKSSTSTSTSSFKSSDAMSPQFSNTPHYGGIESETSTRASGSMMNRGMDAIQPLLSNIRTRVTANPWVGVGVAAGVCLGIGYMLGRRFIPSMPSVSTSPYVDRPLSENMGINSAF